MVVHRAGSGVSSASRIGSGGSSSLSSERRGQRGGRAKAAASPHDPPADGDPASSAQRRRRDDDGGVERRHAAPKRGPLPAGSERRDGVERSDGRRAEIPATEGKTDDFERALERLGDDDPSLVSIDWRLGRRRRNGDGRTPGPIGPLGGARLAVALRHNTTLSILRMDGHDMGDAGMASFLLLASDDSTGQWRSSALEELRLRHNSIGPNGAEALAKLLIDEDLAARCENCRRRTERGGCGGSSHSDSGDDGSAPCVASALLDSLSLPPLRRPNGGMPTPVLPRLTRLDLSRNPLGPLGARSLSRSLLHNSALSVLSLCSARLGDEGARHLSHLLRNSASLCTLRISNNNITSMGACALFHSLWDNSVLAELDVCDNPDVGDNGGCALGDMLGQNGTLTWLYAKNCGLGDLAAMAVAEGLMASTGRRADRGEEDGRPGEEESSPSSSSSASPSSSPLAVLDLSRNRLTPDGARSLSSALPRAASLHRLDLSGNREIGDGGARLLADALRCAPSRTFALRELALRDAGLTEEGAVDVGQAAMRCDRLEVLELGDNGLDAECRAAVRGVLRHHGTLRRLNLGDERGRDDGQDE